MEHEITALAEAPSEAELIAADLTRNRNKVTLANDAALALQVRMEHVRSVQGALS